ncbi:MAG: MerR family transcriptional regulator [Streptosporangiales bacterium]|nr:MerR family transcriptional regulator [Streptosporangiales bacterium]
MTETYSLEELADGVGRALDALRLGVPNARVRARPDPRTIRYYTQLGLVDRPLPAAGRQARYGRRHLLQVVAVKRLQAAGVSLAEIQRRLTGAADEELYAAIGPGAEAVFADPTPRADAGGDGAGERPVAARSAAFWRAAPNPTPADPALPAAGARPDVRRQLVVPLAAGIELSVDLGTTDDAAVDPATLRAAAEPLLDHLRAAGVLAIDV